MSNYLENIVKAQKAGKAAGMYSICSANRFVIEAAMLQAKADGSVLCIEATSNQVDQFGGYTGMTPVHFVAYVKSIALLLEFPFEKVLLGGDHLGPNAWRKESADSAMAKARELLTAYAKAGFTKIHLDASMKCASDPGAAPSPKVIAERAAELCLASEAAGTNPVYIVGTEVPTPGGATSEHEGLHVTRVEDVEETITEMHAAFKKLKLEKAWERVHAVVVQPGVEFGDASVDLYDSKKAQGLAGYIKKHPNLVYEAHSTDYQSGKCLTELVRDHFAVLKVGPWLTFALREAVFAMENMEKEYLGKKSGVTLSKFQETLEKVMLKQPEYWKNYYKGSETEVVIKRKYSYSDRCRYYWPVADVNSALERLLENLKKHTPPVTLLSQYMPNQYAAINSGLIKYSPETLIHSKIMEVTSIYSKACNLEK